jgi:hypothetical protein
MAEKSFFNCNACARTSCHVNGFGEHQVKSRAVAIVRINSCPGHEPIKRTIPFPVLVLNHPNSVASLGGLVGVDVNMKAYLKNRRW